MMKTEVNNNMENMDVEITATEEKVVATPIEKENKKLTKKDWFLKIRDFIIASEDCKEVTPMVAFIDHEIALLEKRTTSSKGSTSVNEANKKILSTLRIVLTEQSKPITIAELLADERLLTWEEEKKGKVVTNKMSSQKLSALMKKLVDSGEVVRTTEKKKAYFILASKVETKGGKK